MTSELSSRTGALRGDGTVAPGWALSVLLAGLTVSLVSGPVWASTGGTRSRPSPTASGASEAAHASEAAGASDASDASEASDEALRVGVVGSSPFVITDRATPRGLSLDIWRLLAEAAGVSYDFSVFSTVDAALAAVAAGRLDVVVGPISITSARCREVHFLQPYFQSSLSILASTRRQVIWDRFAPFLNRAFFAGTGMLILILAGVGTLVWLAERKKNEGQFPNAVGKGVGAGTWFALVTMTTVGYGDKVPVTTLGRVISGVWMIISLLTVSSLTGAIATALTLAQLDEGLLSSADQMSGRKVAVVAGTVGVDFAHRHRARVLPVGSVDEAVARVLAGEADAVVHDRPMLLHYLQEHPDVELQLAEASYEPQGYGFAVAPLRGALQSRLNVALLEILEAGQGRMISARWLGDDRP
ncbi:MAG: transporter substrate-binding domain-containing protein [Deltaproteobacteria bacterium]|nr:transporter substrate-binding domain-containing protein [Deltaproteobacteria bacterium]